MDNMEGLICIVIILAADLYLVSAKTSSLVIPLPPVKAGQSAQYNCSSEGTGPDPTIVWSLKDSNGVEKLNNAQLNGTVVEGAADSADGRVKSSVTLMVTSEYLSSLHRLWCGAIDSGSSVPSIQIYAPIQATTATTVAPLDIDECTSTPCHNGGQCIDGINSYACVCAPGFTGTTCDSNIDECVSRPCQNGGKCVDGNNSYTCDCAAGFTGITCYSNINECISAPCYNGGQCIDGNNSYTCACTAGFSGISCDSNIDECASRPCQNGGKCVDGNNSFTCDCAAGFTGISCYSNINECISAPCHNGGQCIDGTNSYTCACTAGFSGISCDSDFQERIIIAIIISSLIIIIVAIAVSVIIGCLLVRRFKLNDHIKQRTRARERGADTSGRNGTVNSQYETLDQTTMVNRV